MSNHAAINRALRADGFTTGDLPASGLTTDQVEAFYELASTSEKNSKFYAQIPRKFRNAPSGSIPTLSVGARNLTRKIEAVNTGGITKPTSGSVDYAVVKSRILAEISEDTFDENILKQDFERVALKILTSKVGVDIEDLTFNGDTTTDPSDPDYGFLSLNNGILKIVTDNGNAVDGSTYNAGAVHEDMFFDAAAAIPGNFIVSNDGVLDAGALATTGYRWCVSWNRLVKWKKYVAQRADQLGESAFKIGIGGDSLSPLGIPFSIQGANFPDDKILLAKPACFTVVFTYTGLRIRKTTEGLDAVARDVRHYAIHTASDVVSVEPESASVIYGLTA